MVGIQLGDAVETKKKPTRKGKVLKAAEYLTWIVEFKDEKGTVYTETLRSSQLKKIGTAGEATQKKSGGFKKAVQRAVDAITPKKKARAPPARREPAPQQPRRNLLLDRVEYAEGGEEAEQSFEAILQEDEEEDDKESSRSSSASTSHSNQRLVTTRRQRGHNNNGWQYVSTVQLLHI